MVIILEHQKGVRARVTFNGMGTLRNISLCVACFSSHKVFSEGFVAVLWHLISLKFVSCNSR